MTPRTRQSLARAAETVALALAWASVVLAAIAMFAALCRLLPCQYLSFD